jgi:thiol-disulfide isomerase/thioredoxin
LQKTFAVECTYIVQNSVFAADQQDLMRFALAILLSWVTSILAAQTGYKEGDIVIDIPLKKVLNYSPAPSFFNEMKSDLTIVDFFGTWCVPCVKALPKLATLQQQFKDKISILLVSNEPETKLSAFISKRESFSLPVVVDAEDEFTRLFQPPSYPYSVILNKTGKVIAIPKEDELNETNINKWLSAGNKTMAVAVEKKEPDTPKRPLTQEEKTVTDKIISSNGLVQLSQDFMYTAKTGAEISRFITQLRQIGMNDLQSTIKTDDEKKAFWINLYNGYTQVSLKKNPDQYKKRSQFFGSKQIEIAGHEFSLDDIEHGILRRSKIKWSLGHLSKLFPDKTEKNLRVGKLDYRLHFALNCGAKSCPPIAFYKAETIDQQLDLAAKAYLRGEAEYDEATNTVNLPALMSWFRRDFGGKKKMMELLKQLSIIPPGKKPKIKFRDYDWTLYLQNYKS